MLWAFNHVFGPEEWLTPYTEELLADLGKQGLKKIAAVCPAFVTDCLETIDEVGSEGSKQFCETGGEKLHLIPCLNDSDRWIKAMKEIALVEMQGWV